MSKSNWRGHIALGGIAAFALLVIWLVLYLPNAGSIENYREYKQASREYPKDEDAARESRIWLRGVLEDGRPDKAAKQGEDAKPESGEYTTALDLRAQWATAIAAAEMVALTRLQLFFGLAGLIGLWFTVYYARQTAVGAIEAAKVANQNLTLQFRPKLVIRHVEAKVFGSDKPFSVEFQIANIGAGDAKIVGNRVMLKCDIPSGNPIKVFGNQICKIPNIIKPGQMVGPITANSGVEVWNKQGFNTGILAGYILYEDDIGIIRHTRFYRFFANGVWNVVKDSHPDQEYAD